MPAAARCVPGGGGSTANANVLLALLISLASVSSTSTARAQELAPRTAGTERLRIGLVLGGGGARGAAHIGVLHLLEEMRIPVDCIAGTSMGALIGGAYATGMTSAEVEKTVVAIDWSAAFGSAVTRDLQPVHLKTHHVTYSNALEFGLNEQGLVTPGGLVASQQIDSLLRSIVSRARHRDSFDDLPIPFRAVATDIGSGEVLVLSSGDLSVAMRASMAVPGVFAPVQLDGHVMVDGGLVRNLPVDVAREMCADVVIASSLVDAAPDVAKLQSALAVVGRMIDITIKNNERAQLATLGANDVRIMISLPDMTSGDFDKTPSAIPLGAAAARTMATQLARYSLTPEAYAAWRAGLENAVRAERVGPTVRAIRIGSLTRSNREILRRQIESRVGEPLDEARVIEDAQRIFSRGDFAKVDYTITTANSGAELEFLPLEKPWGPNYLRFDLGMSYSTGGDTGFVLRADHLRTAVTTLGGRWYNTLQVGRTSLLETSLLQPLDLTQRLFVEPRLRISRELQDLYRGEQRVARYEYTYVEGQVDAGVSFGTWGELRLGLKRSQSDYTTQTGDVLLREFRDIDSAGIAARFLVDSRDTPFLPTRGTYLNFNFYSSEAALGGAQSYQRAEIFGQRVFRLRGNLLYLEAAGGSDFGSNTPSYERFTLGGISQLAGFESEELRGREYAFARVAYLWKVTDLQTLFGQALYAGVSLEAGNMFERIDGADAEGAILGSSLFFGGRTPLGPLTLVFGISEGGRKAAYLQLGRPLKER